MRSLIRNGVFLVSEDYGENKETLLRSNETPVIVFYNYLINLVLLKAHLDTDHH